MTELLGEPTGDELCLTLHLRYVRIILRSCVNMHVSTSEYTWWYILFDIRCISQHTYIYPGMEENRIVNKPIVV